MLLGPSQIPLAGPAAGDFAWRLAFEDVSANPGGGGGGMGTGGGWTGTGGGGGAGTGRFAIA